MATLTVTDDTLHLRLTRGERLAALRGDLRVPLSAVTAVSVEAEARPRGLRAPGLAVPGRRRLIGTWRARGHRTLISTRRGEPVVRIVLTGAREDEVLVSSPDADRIAAELAGATGLVR